ncbi:hypothetical protein SLS53_009186 [Cytospora paraplurivora]|uniref:AB hydrolase-1 domain-containing protein n=1 Tax=Cytospora paraplurivora TaxID=2898453 RepID=A0AAN9TYQ7_9PEZI
MAATLTVEVSHLGGIKAGYAISGSGLTGKLDPSKPTCVLINALHTTVAFWRPQFENKELTMTMNLLAIEPLGHGATTCPIEHFTYWDTATMALQVMDKLGAEKAFAMGTSQGGFIVTRMALIAPERGSKDAIWPAQLATEQIQLFTSSPSANATIIPGGSHFLNVTEAGEVNTALLEFVKQNS